MIKPLENCVEAFSALPTIGKKSAWRLAMHLLEHGKENIDNLSKCLLELKDRVLICKQCFNYSESEICSICSSPKRDKSVICVVEKPVDAFTIEKSGRYHGLYHILGGILSPINGITSDKLRIKELLKRLESEEIKELIIGLGCSSDAETTSIYLARILSESGIRVTQFARGLPAGTELEYVDEITLCQALNERRDIHYNSSNGENK